MGERRERDDEGQRKGRMKLFYLSPLMGHMTAVMKQEENSKCLVTI